MFRESKSLPLRVVSEFVPRGDQPQAILRLSEALQQGIHTQILMGVTGSGKTFTMANIIESTGRPALIIAPNKILAAQLHINPLR